MLVKGSEIVYLDCNALLPCFGGRPISMRCRRARRESPACYYIYQTLPRLVLRSGIASWAWGSGRTYGGGYGCVRKRAVVKHRQASERFPTGLLHPPCNPHQTCRSRHSHTHYVQCFRCVALRGGRRQLSSRVSD